MNELVGHLRELMEQWKESATVLRPIDQDGAIAYLECREELGQILNGDLSSIEKIRKESEAAG